MHLELILQDRAEEGRVLLKELGGGILGVYHREARVRLDALLECLDREGNRPISKGSASVADNNEGGCPVSSNGAVWEALAHVFDAVRSSVRESACSALVMLCTHADDLEGSQVERIAASLEAVVRFDKNVVARGFAIDAFNRLAGEGPALRARADAAIGNCPVQCLDVLDRASSWATTY